MGKRAPLRDPTLHGNTKGPLYRVFLQDVGREGYSGLVDVIAPNEDRAVATVLGARGYMLLAGGLVARSHADKHLWPDGRTGRLPERR